MNNLNISLKSQLDISKMEFATLQSKIKVRQEQDHTEIQSLQLELTKLRQVLHMTVYKYSPCRLVLN